jgi:ABC-type nitrate/sulfonate/bicarbonate transport system ATPase subunit
MNCHKNGVILQAENVSLRIGEKQILRDINFCIHDLVRPNVKQGQVVSLVGRSGIGKTQLFKIISGLLEPTTGVVKLDTDLHPVKAGQVGVIPQSYILFNHRTVQNNLRIGLEHSKYSLSEKERDGLICEYAENFGLMDHLKKFPMQLSGGQRQRVSIIQQVLTGNKFILLDEPFSGLDLLMVDKVVEVLIRISTLHEHNTLIIVSHDVENSMAISDTAFILANEHGKEGATITEQIDLVESGLAWNPDIKNDRRFHELVAEMKYKI